MNNQYLFNVKYYDGLYTGNNDAAVEDANKKLTGYKFGSTAGIPDLTGIKTRYSFFMKTVYPGLLIGLGNPHSSGMSPEEIKLGFSLDYTTGLPYIPGSTVKGVLRSVFKKPEIGKTTGKKDAEIKRVNYNNRQAFLKELIASVCELPESSEALKSLDLSCLEEEIFGDNTGGKRDVFFDAYPVSGGADSRLFAFESITPHKELTKNPIPLRLLKVIPDVVFEFNFSLNDSKVFPPLTAKRKKILFANIISVFGMGAKTNTGFGIMEETDKPAAKPAAPAETKSETNNSMERGRIESMKYEKGFGFIRSNNNTKVFFHYTACRGVRFEDLYESDRVEFEAIETDKGLKATIVKKI